MRQLCLPGSFWMPFVWVPVFYLYDAISAKGFPWSRTIKDAVSAEGWAAIIINFRFENVKWLHSWSSMRLKKPLEEFLGWYLGIKLRHFESHSMRLCAAEQNNYVHINMLLLHRVTKCKKLYHRFLNSLLNMNFNTVLAILGF